MGLEGGNVTTNIVNEAAKCVTHGIISYRCTQGGSHQKDAHVVSDDGTVAPMEVKCKAYSCFQGQKFSELLRGVSHGATKYATSKGGAEDADLANGVLGGGVNTDDGSEEWWGYRVKGAPRL